MLFGPRSEMPPPSGSPLPLGEGLGVRVHDQKTPAPPSSFDGLLRSPGDFGEIADNGFPSGSLSPAWCLIAAVLWALLTSFAGAGELAALPPPPAAVRLPLHRFETDFVAMGMKYHIALYAPDEQVASSAIEAVVDRVQFLDCVMSDYNTESELSRLCEASGPGKPVRVSAELFTVLAHAVTLAEQTEGAFNVTVGPVVELWRTARRQKRLPPEAALQAALKKVDWRKVGLDPLAQTVEFGQAEMQIDLGGIAAGYALDEAAELLAARGLRCVLIDASGDVLVGDPPPGREGWRITVAGLAGNESDPEAQSLTLRNCAVTTSGDAKQFVDIDGTRYSHIVDPQTGWGLTRRSSTTVIAPTGWQADSYATAVNVMGHEAGTTWLARQPGCSAVMLEMTSEGLQRTATPGFPAMPSQHVGSPNGVHSQGHQP